MTGKPKQKRSKQSINSRKARNRQRLAGLTQTPADPQPTRSSGQQELSSPVETVPRQSTRPQAIHYPFVTTELRTIGILAAMILVIIIILYFTLG